MAAAFTNLSRDHLDYHPDFEAYRTAKLRLFTELLPATGTAVVVDADEEASTFYRRGPPARADPHHHRSGEKPPDHRHPRRGDRPRVAERLHLRHNNRDYSILLPLIGAFQVDNALTAAGLAIACGVAPQTAFAALEHFQGAPGRLEFVGSAGGAPVIVDYAHKPDALDKVLEALRPFAKGRLCVVFGCGGDRDPGKRPIMGAIAAAKADQVIVTDDNPRSEDPTRIRAAILAAHRGPSRSATAPRPLQRPLPG